MKTLSGLLKRVVTHVAVAAVAVSGIAAAPQAGAATGDGNIVLSAASNRDPSKASVIGPNGAVAMPTTWSGWEALGFQQVQRRDAAYRDQQWYAGGLQVWERKLQILNPGDTQYTKYAIRNDGSFDTGSPYLQNVTATPPASSLTYDLNALLKYETPIDSALAKNGYAQGQIWHSKYGMFLCVQPNGNFIQGPGNSIYTELSTTLDPAAGFQKLPEIRYLASVPLVATGFSTNYTRLYTNSKGDTFQVPGDKYPDYWREDVITKFAAALKQAYYGGSGQFMLDPNLSTAAVSAEFKELGGKVPGGRLDTKGNSYTFNAIRAGVETAITHLTAGYELNVYTTEYDRKDQQWAASVAKLLTAMANVAKQNPQLMNDSVYHGQLATVEQVNQFAIAEGRTRAVVKFNNIDTNQNGVSLQLRLPEGVTVAGWSDSADGSMDTFRAPWPRQDGSYEINSDKYYLIDFNNNHDFKANPLLLRDSRADRMVYGVTWQNGKKLQYDSLKKVWYVLEQYYVNLHNTETSQQLINITPQPGVAVVEGGLTPAQGPVEKPKMKTAVYAEYDNGKHVANKFDSATALELDGSTAATIKDKVKFSDLARSTNYTLTTGIYTVDAAGNVKQVPGIGPDRPRQMTSAADGTIADQEIEVAEDLQVGKDGIVANQRYFVGHVLRDRYGNEVVHINPNDAAQSFIFVVKEPKLQTTAVVAGHEAGNQGISLAANQTTAPVADKVTYADVAPGRYTLAGNLVKVNADGSYTSVKQASTTVTADAKGEGTWNLDFGTVKFDQLDSKYVVLEYLLPAGKNLSAEQVTALGLDGDATKDEARQNAGVIASHADLAAGAQTILTQAGEVPGLATVVTAGGQTSTDTAAATVSADKAQVSDTVYYSNVAPGSYWVVGQLVEVVPGRDPNVVATGSTQLKVDGVTAQTGAVTVDFGEQKIRQSTDTEKVAYVVREYLIANDKNVSGISGDFARIIHLEGNAEKIGKLVAKHDDLGALSQTFMRPKTPAQPSIGTTVSVDGVAASDQAPASATGNNPQVTDAVAYKDVPKGDYLLIGRLMQVTGEQEKPEPLAVAVQKVSSAGGSGTWNVDFGRVNLPAAGADTKYVVHEFLATLPADGQVPQLAPIVLQALPQAVPAGTTLIAVHADNKAQSQTFVTKESRLATTVSADGVKANADAAAVATSATPEVTDEVRYENIAAGQYTLAGRLVKVVDGVEAGVVATASTNVTVAAGAPNGTWNLPFGKVELEQGTNIKYVVHEFLLQGAPEVSAHQIQQLPTTVPAGTKVVASHADNNDQAQTIVVKVPSLKTTAHVDGEQTTNPVRLQDDVNKFTVTDTVTYENIAPGQYTLAGVLVKRDAAGNYTVAGTKTAPVAPAETGAGTWELQFDEVTLSAADRAQGASFVVLEYLLAAEKAPFTAAQAAAAAQGKDIPGVVASHADRTATAQTVLVPKRGEMWLGTTASAAYSAGDQDVKGKRVLPAGIDQFTVTDTVLYRNVPAAGPYTLVGVLVKKTADGAVSVVEQRQQQVTPAGQAGAWTMEFSPVAVSGADATAGAQYVVLEYLYQGNVTGLTEAQLQQVTSNPELEGPLLQHADLAATSQTVVLPAAGAPEMGTVAVVDEVAATTTSAAIVKSSNPVITDTVTLKNIPAGNYHLIGRLVKIVGDDTAHPTNVGVVQSPVRVTGGAVREMTVKMGPLTNDSLVGKGLVASENGQSVRYVFFEYLVPQVDKVTWNYAVSLDKNSPEVIVAHEDANAPEQTVLRLQPAISTRVEATGEHGSVTGGLSAAATVDDVVTVTDHVDYSNVLAGSYQLVGHLVQVAADGTKTVIASQVQRDLQLAGNGTTSIDFGEVTLDTTPEGQALRYVVFEYLLPNDVTVPDNGDLTGKESKIVASHADASAPSQTVLYRGPQMGTTITAGDQTAGEQPATINTAEAVPVTDQINYTNFGTGWYTFFGELRQVKVITENGKTRYEVGDVVASQRHVELLTSGAGTVTMDFGEVEVPEYTAANPVKLVAFEYAVPGNVSTKPETGFYAAHENPADQAQSVINTHETPVEETPEQPEQPGLPGEETPTTPETPETGGETPTTPETPETPVTPEQPGTPGEETPTTPGTPQTGGETPEIPEVVGPGDGGGVTVNNPGEQNSAPEVPAETPEKVSGSSFNPLWLIPILLVLGALAAAPMIAGALQPAPAPAPAPAPVPFDNNPAVAQPVAPRPHLAATGADGLQMTPMV